MLLLFGCNDDEGSEAPVDSGLLVQDQGALDAVVDQSGAGGEALLDAAAEDAAPKPDAAPELDVASSVSDEIQWIPIEGGVFMMGSTEGDDDEEPLHEVNISDFEISKTEVTLAQYRRCVEVGACSEPDNRAMDEGCSWGHLDRENHPLNCVDWEQAVTFATWAGGRLPSESEWEYAARGRGRELKYPWGDEAINCSFAVMDDGGPGCGEGRAWAVCSKEKGHTPEGLCDMSGNLWEWLADTYASNYLGVPDDGSPNLSSGSEYVLRGGSWSNSGGLLLRVAYRYSAPPALRGYYVGFRLAR